MKRHLGNMIVNSVFQNSKYLKNFIYCKKFLSIKIVMINKILIQNYKSIRNAEIELKPLNVLIGANGAGKSNFISYFELLKSILESNLQNYVKKNAGAESLLYYGSQESEFLLSIIFNNYMQFYGYKLLLDKSNN